jgi:hypothetical protein
VTGMTVTQAWDHVHVAEELWVERSQRMWELDLRMLTGAGVTLRRPERAADRAAVAARALHRERTEFSSNGAVIEDM